MSDPLSRGAPSHMEGAALRQAIVGNKDLPVMDVIIIEMNHQVGRSERVAERLESLYRRLYGDHIPGGETQKCAAIAAPHVGALAEARTETDRLRRALDRIDNVLPLLEAVA